MGNHCQCCGLDQGDGSVAWDVIGFVLAGLLIAELIIDRRR